MKLEFIHCGRPSYPAILKQTEEYKKRIEAWHKVQVSILKLELREADRRSPQKPIAQTINKAPGDFIVGLHEKGQLMTSLQCAEWLGGILSNPAHKTLKFVVGPSYGFDEASLKSCNSLWSLSPLTLQGDIAWLVLWEQVYRALSIRAGHPYHHE